MLRASLAFVVLAPIIAAQTAEPTPPPIIVSGTVAPIDPEVWQGFTAGPGLFRDTKNVSGRDIQGWVYETSFTDPHTGKALVHREHSQYKPPASGVALAAGATAHEGKPYPLLGAPSGAQAAYSFTIDLVVFTDGTTWGPARTQTAQRLLAQLKEAQGKPK